MGFGGSWNNFWTAQHRPIVDYMRDRYDAWAAMHLKRSRCARGFAEFLMQPAAQGLRCEALIWFAHAADEVGDQDFNDSGVESSITSFLDICWAQHRPEILVGAPRHSTVSRSFYACSPIDRIRPPWRFCNALHRDLTQTRQCRCTY